jgi:hypothetical protein
LVTLPPEVLRISPLHINEGDGRAILGMDMPITTSSREHSSLWNIAHPPPSKARQLLNRLKAPITPQKQATNFTQRQVQSLQDDRENVYGRLNSDTRDWLKRVMKIRLILTLSDFTPQNLFLHNVTLGELLFYGSRNTNRRGEPSLIKFMDWVNLFQLKRADAEQWLEKLGYTPYFHAVYHNIFPGSDVVQMGLHWDQIRRNKIFWPHISSCLRYTILPSARDWLDLGFRFPSAQEGMTREIFFHLAFYGAWTFDDCLEMGLSPEVVSDLGLTLSDFEYLASEEEDTENADKIWPAEKIATLFVDIEAGGGGGGGSSHLDCVVNGLLEDEEEGENKQP